MTDDTPLWQWSLDRFRRETASSQPTPGCGAASVIAADIGLALVLKGLRITAAKRSTPELQHLLSQGDALLERLGEFANDDIRAFSRYLQASQTGEIAPTEAARQACAVPLATGHACLEALKLATAAWPLCAVIVRSDVQAGALLIRAGLDAVLLNVDADLPSLEDDIARTRASEARQRLQRDARALHMPWAT
ncbi:cyclodeaminase/cyclohydrolase family protein [Stutzerimonas tarimensis]|uniref:Cyclodeaminase/cyclohydrolase family protein n=1 Tax=Stutzerimonas tarimensis TaxID=1507735 RepID=A0ABV7TDM0_9GAMM